jgi:hypothetical protein
MIVLIGNGESCSVLGAEIAIDDEGEGIDSMADEVVPGSVALWDGLLTASFAEGEVDTSSEVTANSDSRLNSRDQRCMLLRERQDNS